MSIFEGVRRKQQKIGEPQGTLTYIGARKHFEPSARAVAYSKSALHEARLDRAALLAPQDPFLASGGTFVAHEGVRVVNLLGVHDPALVRVLGEATAPLPTLSFVLEDVLNTGQRPKAEEIPAATLPGEENGPDALFLVLKAVSYEKDSRALTEEQVSLLWRGRRLALFQELEDDVAEPVLKRLANKGGRLRRSAEAGAGMLVTALLDTVTDRYFDVLASLMEEAEALETELLSGTQLRPVEQERMILRIYDVKRAALTLRTSLMPLAEALERLLREEAEAQEEEDDDEAAPRFDATSLASLRDVREHAVQALESVDTVHELLTNLISIHISLAELRANAVMRLLTVVATIFIPLTFLVGVYGMNFTYMPELSWRMGYFFLLGLMTLLGLAMAVWFRKKRWW